VDKKRAEVGVVQPEKVTTLNQDWTAGYGLLLTSFFFNVLIFYR